MVADRMRLSLPEPRDDAHPLDWYPEDSEQIGLPGTLTETSYTLPEGLNLGQWLAIGETLQRMERSVLWWLGDWWRYGQRREYGDYVSQAARDHIRDVTGHAYKTVLNAGTVAGAFELSRRRENVPFAYHADVAALPADDADALLDAVEQSGMKRPDLRDLVKKRQNAIAVEVALTQPAPAPSAVPRRVRIEAGDARSLPLPDASVHLIVTSPPYGVGIDEYREGGDVLAGDWPAFMLDWLTEALRVTVPTGRLALNVPLDTTSGGYRPTYAQAVHLAEAAGWEYRSTILWVDDQLGKSTARGSMDSASAPHIIAGAEMVALFSNGAWKRNEPGESTLDHADWLEWTNGVWRFPGETRAWEGHPAPFPFELPRRLIRLLSFKGDTVLDPFCGSGTTALAACQLDRDFVGFDRSPEYVKSALRRVTQ
jgi:site-specific DNA-methyltransferase (adenine-specific)